MISICCSIVQKPNQILSSSNSDGGHYRLHRAEPRKGSCGFKSGLRIRARASAIDEALVLQERDWSFLEAGCRDLRFKHRKLVKAGNVDKGSTVAVALGTLQFVDCFMAEQEQEQEQDLQEMVVYHYSLLQLADIKEKYDSVRCKQGEIGNIAKACDVFFLNHVPALKQPLPSIVSSLVPRCNPGARLIISDVQGREQLAENKRLNPDLIIGDLPDQSEMERILRGHPLQLVNFVDDPDFYFVTLLCSKV